MAPRVLLPAAAAALLLAAGCSSRAPAAPHPDGGAAAAARGPLDAAAALRAMAMTHDEAWQRLGPHRFHAKQHLQVTVGDGPAEVLDEEHLLEAGTAGAFHVRSQNSHDLGREAVLTGGELYVRPRYGTFVRRHPEPGEAERLRAETFGELAAAAELLGRFVAVRPEGHAIVGGRDALRATLTLAPHPRPAPTETEPGRRWRATVVVRRLAGTLAVDAQTGAPLAGTLDAEYTFTQGGRVATATLAYEGAVEPGAEVAVTAPAHVPEPHRTRYYEERQQLLRGLVPPGAGQP